MLLGNFRTQIIRWNKASNNIRGKFRAASSDEHGRRLMVQITNDGVYDNVVGGALYLYWNSKTHKTDGLDVFTLVNEQEGLYELYYTTELLSNVGPLSCNLYFVDSEGSITSEQFNIFVFRGINVNAIESSNSFSSLMDALSRVVAIETQEEERQSNEVTRNSQETTRQDQESTRQSNESERNTEESSRAQSESLRVSAENLRKTAEEARVLAESSREDSESTRESNEDNRKSDELAREQNYNQLMSNAEDLLVLLDQKYEGFEGEYATRLNQIEQTYYPESGSNDDGYWVQLPDKTLIVYKRIANRNINSTPYNNLYRSFVNGSFPKTFSVSPIAMMRGTVSIGGSSKLATFHDDTVSTTGYSFMVLSNESFASLSNTSLFAIGKGV